jgi:integrase
MGTAGAEMSLLERFEQWERRRNLSRRTIVARHRRLTALEAHVGGDLFDADAEQVEAWLDSAHRPLTPPSRYTYISEVNAFYQWAVREGYLLTNPCDRVVRPRLPLRTPRPLSMDAVHAMLAAASRRDAVWVALGAFAGFRVSEMAHLQVPEVDFVREKLLVLGAKGNKDGVVPLHPLVAERLRMLPVPRSGLVTPRERGGAYNPATVGMYLSRLMDRCGVDGTPHQLRHFFVTEVVEASGGDLLVGKEAARHASITTTAGYAAHSRGRLDEAVRSIGEGARGRCCPSCGSVLRS